MANKYRVEKDEYDVPPHWDIYCYEKGKDVEWIASVKTRRLARIWCLFLNTISWIDRKDKK